MKLLKFNATSLPQLPSFSRKGSKPSVSFNKNGLISFNKKAMEIIGLQPSDKVCICQDESNPEDWFVTKDPEGFALRHNMDKSMLNFNHRLLQTMFIEHHEMDPGKTHRFPLAQTPTTIKGKPEKYWCILIKEKI